MHEVVNLEVADLDFQRRVMKIRRSKFGKTRTVPFIDSNFMTDLRQLTQGSKAYIATEKTSDAGSGVCYFWLLVEEVGFCPLLRPFA